MKQPLPFLIVFAIATLAVSFAGAQDTVDFNRDIRPILSDKCIFCHGPDKKHRGADLRLDIEESAKDFAIAEHDPDDSALIERIESKDRSELMPPPESGKKLTEQEKQLLRRWIDEGAVWSEQWAYVAPAKHAIPSVDSDWPLNWIDQFILDRMPEGIQPNPDTDQVTLLRRLHFDLTGLPPTPTQVESFLADKSELAYKKVVDELLASPHFGERMAMYWLDLVRYADTVGYHGDQDHNISPYRDWVIQSLNDNMPFDQFTREQLAGDLFESPTTSQQIASGYNRLLQTTHEGGLQPKEYIAIYAADRVRNFSAVWMGGTLGCAQCHDHKYDPYTINDFYSMAAFFADIDDTEHFTVGTNALPTRRPPELSLPTDDQRTALNDLNQTLAQIREQLKKERDDAKKTGHQEEVKSTQAAIKRLESQIRRTMITKAQPQPRTTRVFPRRNWLDETGPIVEPAIPEFLGKIETGNSRATRLDLANWLTDLQKGSGKLTARVMANRFWYLLNGHAIAADLDDFGGQGSPPVAPRLLDNLAIEFVESGWDVKHLIRLIVTSRTYRQSSIATETQLAADPNNQWFARAGRYRLPAETIRDNALLVSGLLVDEIGGPSSKPYQPAGYYRHLNFPPRKYKHDNDKRQYRRGVYIHWQRQFLHPMLRSLDAPTREECTAERPRSNTPLAALTLLNDPSFIEAARVFADRTLSNGGKDFESRLRFVFQWTLSRKPNAKESGLLKSLFEQTHSEFQANPEAAKKLTSTGLAPKSKHDVTELAAWTTVIRAVFNLNENLTRN
jgi:hypothetical protein